MRLYFICEYEQGGSYDDFTQKGLKDKSILRVNGQEGSQKGLKDKSI